MLTGIATCVFSGSSINHDTQALMLLDMATPKWSIFLVNDAWQKVTGISQELAVGSHFWDLFEPPLPAQVRTATRESRSSERHSTQCHVKD